jgi:hypothetical protein
MARVSVSRQRAERVLGALSRGEGVDHAEQWTVLRALPPGLDRELVFRAFETSLTRPHDASSLGTGLTPEYLELYRELVERRPTWPQAIAARHLTAATPQARAEELKVTITRLDQLGVFGLAPAQAEARVRAFAADPHFVEVVREVVAGADFAKGREFHRFTLMSVLLEEGSQESVDVLLPSIQRALEEGGAQLDGWRALLRSKRQLSAEVRPLRELLEARAASRRGGLHKDRVARALGLKTNPLHLGWKWSATAIGERGWSASLHVDFDADPWFCARLSDGERSTTADSNGLKGDPLKLGPLADLLDFPGWFAAATRALEIAWGPPGDSTLDELSWSTLRGRSRHAVSRWHWSGMPPH